ncbi:DUF192 domain-containing protein [Kovacikia minuta CCNUW1]|nr:DUF192 domain-containing protein [Kovacikia minuta CCNUW1]
MRLWLVGQRQLISLIVLELLLISCSPPVPAAAPDRITAPPASNSHSSSAQVQANSAQVLPISSQVKIANQVIQLEVARTPEQQAMGLMYRTELPDDRGMLFPFNPPRPVGFWMKNCNISLDMIFLREGKVLAIASNAPPCKADPCPIYNSNGVVDQVIELRGGRAAELGVKVGDQLKIYIDS